ncbi:MAG: hypothetical protein EOQ31_31470 [Mesorhizobium sp.]|uniref:hypothetical protein n=1 Tax=Mesorhizobium sp. TaxID=1871066 RepID=UPI000FE52720|nr:hypothetical protein [Mesorhizobium sp.]RWA81468.1 MAG: hypothetical protein EOQ31_31470 [Mesorhizobium sp.]
MNSLGNSFSGLTSPAEPQRMHFLNRLENALNRLQSNTDRTVSIAQALTGGWPTGAASAKEAVPQSGVFGAIEEIASAIHRVCDRLDEANAAVQERLP